MKYLAAAASSLAVLISFAISGTVMAEPTSIPCHITYVRPHIDGHMYLGTDMPMGQFCQNTGFYSIDTSTAAGKIAAGVALSALMSGKMVQLDLGGCDNGPAGSNWLVSIYIYA